MYVVRKYIKASSLMEVRRLDKKTEPQEIWIDDEWKNGKNQNISFAVGFDNGINQEED